MNSSSSASSSTQADPRLTVSFSSVCKVWPSTSADFKPPPLCWHTGLGNTPGDSSKTLATIFTRENSYHKHQKRFLAPVSMTVSWCSFKGVFIAKVLSIAFRIIEQETKKRHIISIDLKRVVAQNTSCSVPMSNAGTNCSKPMGPGCIRWCWPHAWR